ncbi:MAG: hypothetical protein ACREFZ_07500 [Acetobacteraceae bacterium]
MPAKAGIQSCQSLLVAGEKTGERTRAVTILREKQSKKWQRAWKIALIERVNPDWDDLAERMWRGAGRNS